MYLRHCLQILEWYFFYRYSISENNEDIDPFLPNVLF